ncbi:hypothetical protein SAMN05216506_101183 [Saccharopolyspora kobensis]|uniref:Uncharacterized protein n=1 Tax=Saccharopolyspora kobensis TaxID=146035 RepID=A0ABY1DIY8_9PSEU|nr:hypothetical protein SAMN05216506_101183 [Saccharopolyspora kobensis]
MQRSSIGLAAATKVLAGCASADESADQLYARQG